MHEQLYNMRKELNGFLKNNRLLKAAVDEVNKQDMIKASLIISNPKHDSIAVEKILDGELQKDVPVKNYVFIENCCTIISFAKSCLEMGNYLDKNFLLSAYRVLAEDTNAYFRKSNPVVYAFNHVPVHSSDIEEKLDAALKRVYSPEAGNNVILKAMYIHNKLIEIYPFQNYSAELAIFAMNYFLMENGITPISMPIRRQDYFDIVGECLKGHRQEEFYDFLCKAVYEKMEGTVEACMEYLKKNV